MLVPVLIAYALFPDTTSRILAQAATEAGPWLTALNLGLAGIGLFMFASGRIVAQSTHQRCEQKLAEAEAELRRRADEDRTTLIPALVRSTDILAKQLDRASNTPPPPSKGDYR
ncbi:MAG TPA: hypothetical protein VK942_13240 [Actinomycetes bacterium]|nr:hypothetical protein [Actinomycetes bacterium]